MLKFNIVLSFFLVLSTVSTVHGTQKKPLRKALSLIKPIKNNIAPEDLLSALTQSFELCKKLAELPNELTDTLTFSCAKCGHKNHAAYFIGTMAGTSCQQELISLNNLLIEKSLTAEQLQVFFLTAINQTKQSCQICQTFNKWITNKN